MLSVSVWCGGGALGGTAGHRGGGGVHLLHSAVVGLTSLVFQEECVPDQMVGSLATVRL